MTWVFLLTASCLLLTASEIREAVNYALRRILGGQKDHVAVRGQRTLRLAGTGHGEAAADVSEVGIFDVVSFDDGSLFGP